MKDGDDADVGRRAFRYAAVGGLLALGAPVGLLLLRLGLAGASPTTVWLADELWGDPALYAYVAISTFVVMSGVGWIVGRYEYRLARDAAIDALTGLLNRRRLGEIMAREISGARRYGNPLTLVLLDVDRFKEINDRFGHAGGDRALILIAEGLRRLSRATDYTARQGGDEFCLLLPHTSAEEGRTTARRLADWLREAPPYAEGAPPITLSMGVAELDPKGDPSADALWQRADTALYDAKDHGRDRISVAP